MKWCRNKSNGMDLEMGNVREGCFLTVRKAGSFEEVHNITYLSNKLITQLIFYAFFIRFFSLFYLFLFLSTPKSFSSFHSPCEILSCDS